MRYSRNIPALSKAECATLQTKTVAVIGCGGLGGYLIEFLARIGVGTIRCIDGDMFEESNLNRQLLSSVSLLGAGKASTAASRIRSVSVHFLRLLPRLPADKAQRCHHQNRQCRSHPHWLGCPVYE